MGVIGFFITTGDGSTVVSWSTTLSLWGQIQRRTPSYMLTCKVGLKPHLNIDASTMNSSSPIVLFTNTYLPFRGAFWIGNTVKVNKKSWQFPVSPVPSKFAIQQKSRRLLFSLPDHLLFLPMGLVQRNICRKAWFLPLNMECSWKMSIEMCCATLTNALINGRQRGYSPVMPSQKWSNHSVRCTGNPSSHRTEWLLSCRHSFWREIKQSSSCKARKEQET